MFGQDGGDEEGRREWGVLKMMMLTFQLLPRSACTMVVGLGIVTRADDVVLLIPIRPYLHTIPPFLHTYHIMPIISCLSYRLLSCAPYHCITAVTITCHPSDDPSSFHRWQGHRDIRVVEEEEEVEDELLRLGSGIKASRYEFSGMKSYLLSDRADATALSYAQTLNNPFAYDTSLVFNEYWYLRGQNNLRWFSSNHWNARTPRWLPTASIPYVSK